MGQRRDVTWVAVIGLGLAILLTTPALAYSSPADLWTPAVLQRIRDRTTLNPHIIPRLGYIEVFFDSEIGEPKWADSEPPYAIHSGDTIRIHGYLATPAIGGLCPGIVIGHGHHGRGSAEVALTVAALGYVALSIDGPSAGQSTGGPQDAAQAWISVEEVINPPEPCQSGRCPHVGHLRPRKIFSTTHLYYTSVQDVADYTVSSKIHYQFAEMAFGTDFAPRFEHFPSDDFPVPPPPAPCD
jgi:hypothetical protein